MDRGSKFERTDQCARCFPFLTSTSTGAKILKHKEFESALYGLRLANSMTFSFTSHRKLACERNTDSISSTTTPFRLTSNFVGRCNKRYKTCGTPSDNRTHRIDRDTGRTGSIRARNGTEECGPLQTGSGTFRKSRAGSRICAEGFCPNGTQPEEERKTGSGRRGLSSSAASI